jgi:hypothetical protein
MCTGTFGCPQGPTVCVIVDVRPRAIAKCSKGHWVHLLAPPPRSSHITPSTSRDMETVSKMGRTITVGLLMLRVRRRNLPVGSEPPRVSSARDEVTQGVATS